MGGAAGLVERATLARPGAPPPAPAVDPTPHFLGGPINAEGVVWQNGRTTDEMRRAWAAGARGAAAKCCGLCLAPLYLSRGEFTCFGCRSNLPIRWRRKVTELWLTGMQAADIARIVGGTKSSVLSYRRRAMLPGRGSPLHGLPDMARKRRATAAANRVAKQDTPKPPTPENRAFFVRPKSSKRSGAATPTPAPGGAVRAVENVCRPKGTGELPRHAPRHGFTSCQYITGRARFCDDAVAAMSPYCAEHTRLCYQGKAA